MPTPAATQKLDGDVLTLAPVRHILRQYRLLLVFGLIGVFSIGLVLVAAAWWIAPVTRVSSIQLSFNFPGVQDGKYPNDLPFSPEELLDPVVLRVVYDRHQLGQWIEFPDFQSALAVSQAAGKLVEIRREYSARLSDAKLTGPDRQAIEKEYLSRLRSAASSFFVLGWHEPRGRVRGVPPDVQAKVLSDIPSVWAGRAEKDKHIGMFASRIPGLNPSISLEGTAGTEALAGLQNQARTLEDGLSSLEKLPGGPQAVLPDGTTLTDLKLRLRAFREQVLPGLQVSLLTRIGSEREAQQLERGLELQLKFRENRAMFSRDRVISLVDTYRDYLAGRPGAGGLSASWEPVAAGGGLDETLLNRLLGLAQEGADRDYLKKMLAEIESARIRHAQDELAVLELRQNLEMLRSAWVRPASGNPAASPLQPPPPQQDRAPSAPSAGLQDSAEQLGRLLDSARQMAAVISTGYLGRHAELYQVTRGFQVGEVRPLGLPRLGITFLAWVVLAYFALGVLLLLHHRTLSLGRSIRHS
jgi:hypothetical protein